MPTKPKPPVKLPPAKIGHVKHCDFIDWSGTLLVQRNPLLGDDYLYCAVLPCRNRQEARGIVRLHRESRANLHARIMAALESEINEGDGLVHLSRQASAVINRLHLIP